MRDAQRAMSVAARPSRRRGRLALVAVLTGSLALLITVGTSPRAQAGIPFGSTDALQQRIVSGSIVDTVTPGRFLRSCRDDTARVSYQVAAIKRHPPARPTVYLLGGSSMRECIVSVSGLSAAIKARCDFGVKVISLASTEQKPSAQLAIVDNLPAGAGGIIVIGIHHPTFALGVGSATRQLHGDDLLIQSLALRDFLAKRLGSAQSASLAKGLTIYLDKYLHKRGLPAFTAPGLTYQTHRYPQTMTTTDAFKHERVQQWLNGRGRPGGPFFTYFGLDAALLEATVKLARAKGFEVLFMESSQNNTIIGDAFEPYRTKYRALCTKLVDEQAAHYVNLNRVAGLAKGDFFDLVHLLPSGRAKWQPRLADSLAQIVTDHIATPPGSSPSPSLVSSGALAGVLQAAIVRVSDASR